MKDLILMDNNKGILFYDGEKVQCHPQLLTIPLWKGLWGNDKHSAKPSWIKWITYIYHAYTRGDTLYGRYLPTERKQMVCVNYLQESANEYLKLDNYLKEHIEDFIKSEWDEEEHMLRQIIIDMDNFVSYLQGQPYVITKKVDYKPEPITVEGEIIDIPMQKIIIEIPNDDIKIKTYKSTAEIIKLKQEYQKQIKREGKKIAKTNTRLFEDP